MNILFVCRANVSRSFMAELLMREEVKKRGLGHISVASAGLHVYPDNPPDPRMVNYLLAMGVPVRKGGAKSVKEEDVTWADLILVMEQDHRDNMTAKWPEADEKIELLGAYTSEGPVPDDIVDPYGRSSYHYRLSQAQISLAVNNLLDKIK